MYFAHYFPQWNIVQVFCENDLWSSSCTNFSEEQKVFGKRMNVQERFKIIFMIACAIILLILIINGNV